MRTQKQIEANYTELIHAGEGITIDKGKISATGSGGSGGGAHFVTFTDDYGEILSDSYNDIKTALTNGQPIFLHDSLTEGVDTYLVMLTLTETTGVGFTVVFGNGVFTFTFVSVSADNAMTKEIA